MHSAACPTEKSMHVLLITFHELSADVLYYLRLDMLTLIQFLFPDMIVLIVQVIDAISSNGLPLFIYIFMFVVFCFKLPSKKIFTGAPREEWLLN